MNTLPIEQFVDKTRIAVKSNQKNLILDVKEAEALAHCLSMVMIKMSGNFDELLNKIVSNNNAPSDWDGGSF